MPSKLLIKNNIELYISSVVILLVMSQIPNSNFMYVFLSIINAELSVLFLFINPGRPYSLQKISNLFLLFFFVIANAVQYSTRTNTSHIPVNYTSEDYVNFQILVLFIILSFNLFYLFYDKRQKKKIFDCKAHYSGKKLIALSCISVVLMLLYFRGDMMHMFFRGLVEDKMHMDDIEQETPFSMLFTKLVRPISFASLMIAFNAGMSKKLRLIIFSLMLIALFPLGIARNSVAMYYLPVLLMSVNRFRKGNLFIIVMLIGLLVIFPFLEMFRFWSGSLEDYHYSLEFLNSGHFDASQEFMIVMMKDTVTWGHQLLGTLLFYIPRSYWPSKPIGSGAFMCENAGVDFGNISMPYWGEGYINFGIFGVLIFTLALSYLCSRLDKIYWDNKNNFNINKPYYMLLIGALLYILRGDLMSSVSATLGAIACVYLVNKLTLIKSNRE